MSDFYMFFKLQFLKIFVTKTNNYTKKFLQAHTDLPNSKARYWKTLTFAEVKGFVACLINIGRYTTNRSIVLIGYALTLLSQLQNTFPRNHFKVEHV